MGDGHCSSRSGLVHVLFGFVLVAAVAANRNAVGQTPIMGWSGYNALCVIIYRHQSPSPPPHFFSLFFKTLTACSRIHALG